VEDVSEAENAKNIGEEKEITEQNRRQKQSRADKSRAE
jgi:hypothetical protein